MHFISALMVTLGAHFSAVWIVVANSWMQTPAGFKIAGEGLHARAEITSFWEMVFNPSSMVRLSHTLVGAWLAGAFLVISVAAYYMLKGRHPNFSRRSMHVGLGVALVACLLQVWLGSESAEIVAKHQPLKLAALEGNFKTQTNAPFYILGIVNKQEERVDYALKIPGMLSLLVHGDVDSKVTGLDQFPRQDWPQVQTVFQSYRLMIATWVWMMIVVLLGYFFIWRGTLTTNRKVLWLMVFSVLAPQLGNQVGWLCAEMGRYPWIVQGHLRISEGLSKAVTANHVLGSIIMFGVVYIFLLALFIYLLDHKIKHGPGDEEEDTPYHAMKTFIRRTDGS